MKSINEFIAASAVIIFPASVLVVDKVYGAVFLLVILLGMWQMVIYRKEIFPVSKGEKLFFFSLCIVMVTVVITTVVNDTDMARADRFLALVLAIPAYYFFRRYLSNEKYIWIGLVTGAFIAIGVAIYQVFFMAKIWRATGVVNPIIFGDLALIMGVMSLAGIGWFRERKQWSISIPLLAISAGILASGLSQVRGAWVAFPFLILLFIWYSSKRVTFRARVLVFSLFVLTIVGIYLAPQTGVQKRVDKTFNNVSKYFSRDDVNDNSRLSSVGSRFEMWKASWIIFQDNPVVGGGWGNYTEKAQKLVDNGVINKNAAKFYHPHNQFVSALAKGGLLGFVAISILFLFPAIIFYKSIKNNSEPKYQHLSLAGLVLLIGFISFSLTESILERSRSIIFFSFYMAVFMAAVQIGQRKNNRNIVGGLHEKTNVNTDGFPLMGTNKEGSKLNDKDEILILLDKDVSEVFRDTKSVNQALRMLIKIARKQC
jgi:O-antigen ligase